MKSHRKKGVTGAETLPAPEYFVYTPNGPFSMWANRGVKRWSRGAFAAVAAKRAEGGPSLLAGNPRCGVRNEHSLATVSEDFSESTAARSAASACCRCPFMRVSSASCCRLAFASAEPVSRLA
jgi:hypothetical protein